MEQRKKQRCVWLLVEKEEEEGGAGQCQCDFIKLENEYNTIIPYVRVFKCILSLIYLTANIQPRQHLGFSD